VPDWNAIQLPALAVGSVRLNGLLGVAAILLLAVLLSTNRRAIRPRVVLAALALQAAIAAFALYTPVGKSVLAGMSAGVGAVIEYSKAGIGMVFGPLVGPNVGFSFALNVLPIIIFFSALMSVLYHWGVMQRVVQWGGGAVRFLLGTGRVDSLTAVGNIFLGQTEAPLLVKPYLPHVTKAQLFAIMTSGMASVAGSVLAAYAQMGIRTDYLIAASFMSAPGGLLMAKIVMPDEKGAPDPALPKGDGEKEEKQANVIMAAAVGAGDGLMLAANIGAMLIAFVSLIALVNGALAGIGDLVGVRGLTLQAMLGYVFAPVMALLDVPWSEAQQVGGVFGEKLILNEFVAYIHLGEFIGELSPKAQAIATFALCGFANLSSIAILMGAFRTLVPDKTADAARFGLHVVAAASLSNLMSAALAGLFIP
jgi:CNT family concentrative nucleoside transporter